MFSGFSHVMIYSAQVEALVGWYREVLGFDVHFATEHYASMAHAGAGLRLDVHGAPGDDPNIGRGPQTYFEVDDIDAVVAVLRERGLQVDDPRSEGESPKFAGFRDPEGNQLGLQAKS